MADKSESDRALRVVARGDAAVLASAQTEGTADMDESTTTEVASHEEGAENRAMMKLLMAKVEALQAESQEQNKTIADLKAAAAGATSTDGTAAEPVLLMAKVEALQVQSQEQDKTIADLKAAAAAAAAAAAVPLNTEITAGGATSTDGTAAEPTDEELRRFWRSRPRLEITAREEAIADLMAAAAAAEDDAEVKAKMMAQQNEEIKQYEVTAAYTLPLIPMVSFPGDDIGGAASLLHAKLVSNLGQHGVLEYTLKDAELCSWTIKRCLAAGSRSGYFPKAILGNIPELGQLLVSGNVSPEVLAESVCKAVLDTIQRQDDAICAFLANVADDKLPGSAAAVLHGALVATKPVVGATTGTFPLRTSRVLAIAFRHEPKEKPLDVKNVLVAERAFMNRKWGTGSGSLRTLLLAWDDLRLQKVELFKPFVEKPMIVYARTACALAAAPIDIAAEFEKATKANTVNGTLKTAAEEWDMLLALCDARDDEAAAKAAKAGTGAGSGTGGGGGTPSAKQRALAAYRVFDFCISCGGKDHLTDSCPTAHELKPGERRCHKCKKVGHVRNECTSTRAAAEPGNV